MHLAMDNEINDVYGSDNEIDDKKHARLLDNVLNLTSKQHVKKPTRTEPTLNISEFNLVKSVTGNKGSVQLSALTKSLKKRASNVILTKKLKNTQSQSHTLRKPLEKPQADRIRRTVAYENAKKQLDRWEPIVTSNRAAPLLRFPLAADTKLEDNEDITTGWRLKSTLEQEIEKLEPKIEVIEVESDSKFPLTMEEMMQQRQETAKLRKFQAYKEIKAHRQNKIKSKKYRRILRREKVKTQMKEFELLQKTDPEQALKKLEEIEKARAEERVSLRHKSTGKWAKSRQVRAKYDKESRQVLAEQLAVSRDLTQKVKAQDSSDSEHEDDSRQITSNKNCSNPWVNGVKTSREIDDFISGYKKFWEEKNKVHENVKDENDDEEFVENVNDVKNVDEVEKLTVPLAKQINGSENVDEIKPKRLKVAKKAVKKEIELKSTSPDWEIESLTENGELRIDDVFDNLEYNLRSKIKAKHDKMFKVKKATKRKTKKIVNKRPKITLDLPVKKKKVIIDEELLENAGNPSVEDPNDLNVLRSIIASKEIEYKQTQTDRKKYDAVPVNLETEIPDLLTFEENEEDAVQRGAISEAFQDDDIADEFAKDKKDEVDKDTPADVDLSLPGWGSWGGKDIKMSKRKRKRFIIKFPKDLPRKDTNKGDLIINENASKKIKSHLVSELPFPFKSVKDFEASVRAPIGNTFVPETAFRKLTQPAIVTKIGAVIEPMTEDVLLKKKKRRNK